MSQNLPSAAVVIGALRVNEIFVLMAYAGSEDLEEPAHPHSLVRQHLCTYLLYTLPRKGHK